MSFPYRVFNDLSARLKAAEANVYEVRKHYEAKITTIVEEYEAKLCMKTFHPMSDQAQQTEHVNSYALAKLSPSSGVKYNVNPMHR